MKVIDTADCYQSKLIKISELHPGECFEIFYDDNSESTIAMVTMLGDKKYYLDLASGYLLTNDNEDMFVIRRFVKMLV